MKSNIGALVWAVVVGVGISACGDDASDGTVSDFAGRYSISVTNTGNDCAFDSWKIGDSLQNIAFDISQNAGEATGELPGLANLYFLRLGISALSGPVKSGSATLTATGTNSIKKGNCAYFVKATAALTLTGNTINGTMSYTPQTNHSSECGVLETCSSVQTIAGNRPPK